MGKLDEREYTARNWRIHQIAKDFAVQDVWGFRTPGARAGDFPRMLEALRTHARVDQQSGLAKRLFQLRGWLGDALGWDEAPKQPVASLRERLPADLREGGAGAADTGLPLTPVYELPNESAKEIANRTVHAVMHLGWVQGAGDDYELRMTVLVKPNGWLGRAYMAAIAPFRHLVVYPAMTRQWEDAWLRRDARASGASA